MTESPTTQAPSSAANATQTKPTLQTLLKRTTTPGKRDYFSLALFIAAGIEGFITLMFSFFVVPQLSATLLAFGAHESWLVSLFLVLLGFVCCIQIGFGVYIRRKKEQDATLQQKYKTLAIILLVASFFFYSFLMGQLLIALLSTLPHLMESIQ